MKKIDIDLIDKIRQTLDVLLEFYTLFFAKIIGVDFDYWVGDSREEDSAAKRASQPVDVAQYGDYFFNLADIRAVVDNYKYLLKRYGSREAVAQEVCDWHDYAVERMGNLKSYINLFHWLLGAPRAAGRRSSGWRSSGTIPFLPRGREDAGRPPHLRGAGCWPHRPPRR